MPAVPESTLSAGMAYLRDLTRRLGLSGFGRWWIHELASFVPARVSAAMERRRARPVLAFQGTVATLWRPTPTAKGIQMTEAARIALDGDPASVVADGRRALAPFANAADGVAPGVVIALAPQNVLRKVLTLPAVMEDHLLQALAYDLDRHTPFRADELYFDAAIVDRDAARNTLQVKFAAARRAIVDPLLRQVESFGARVTAVIPDSPTGASTTRMNLLRDQLRTPASGWSRWRIWLPAALVVAGALTALALPVWQKRADAIMLNRLSEGARVRAEASDALRTELERRVNDYNFPLERKFAYPGTVQVLDEVTRTLPDDTWLTQFELRTTRGGKDVQRDLGMRGESGNAGQLVSLLENSKVFTQATPRSPTTKIQPGPGEIFDVGAKLKPLPPTPRLPLDMLAPPQAVGRALAAPVPNSGAGVPVSPVSPAAPSAPNGPNGRNAPNAQAPAQGAAAPAVRTAPRSAGGTAGAAVGTVAAPVGTVPITAPVPAPQPSTAPGGSLAPVPPPFPPQAPQGNEGVAPGTPPDESQPQ